MRLLQTAVVVMFVALFVGCSQPTSPTSAAANTSAAAALGASDGNASNLAAHAAEEKEVRFKGSLEGTVTVTPLTPPFVSVLIQASGQATHLGRFTVEIPHTVNQALRMASGTWLFTAANGDTLTAEFTGVATLTAPGVLSTTETATITGGTGRFAGATGSFTAERVFTMATSTTTGSFEGTISSPGAAKR